MKRVQESNSGGWHGRASATALLSLAVVLGACNGSVDPVGVASDQSLTAMADTELGAVLTEMTEPLGLSDAQAAEVVAIGDRFGNTDEPGTLWYVAADLQTVLSSAQIAQLSEARERLRERAREAAAAQFGFGDGSFGDRGGLFGGPGPGFGFGAPGGFLGGRGPGGFSGSGEGPDCSQLGEAWGGSGGRDRFGGVLGFGGFGGFGGFAGLELSQDQLDALEAIMLEYGPQLMELIRQRRDGVISKEQFEELAGAIREAIEDAISGVLTEEQIAAIEDGRERAREAGETARAAMIDALGLTDQQLEELKALREDRAQRVCETLVSGGSPEDLRSAHEAAMAEILSEDQIEIIDVHRSLRLHFLVYRLESGEFGERSGF